MRTAIMGQIAAVQSDQDRFLQQVKSTISLASGELIPRMESSERQHSFTQQQIDDLKARLADLESTLVPTVRAASEDLDQKYEIVLKVRSQGKLKPLEEDIVQEQSRADQASDSLLTTVADVTDKFRILSRTNESATGETNAFQIAVRGDVEDLKPRAASLEARIAAYRKAAEVALQSAKESDNIAGTVNRLRIELDDLQQEGLPAAIADRNADAQARTTEAVNEIMQKFTTAALLVGNVQNAVKVNEAQQANLEQQVDKLCQPFLDAGNGISSDETELTNRLTALDKQLKDLSSELEESLSKTSEDSREKRKWVLDQCHDDRKDMLSIAATVAGKLQDQWVGFHEINQKVQSTVAETAAGFTKALTGEKPTVPQRIDHAERRLQWCVDRIKVWQKEDQFRTAYKVEIEPWADQLQKHERTLYALESGLSAIDSEAAIAQLPALAASPFEVQEKPAGAAAQEDLPAIAIDPGDQLTYPEDDPGFEWPVSAPARAEGDAPAKPKPVKKAAAPKKAEEPAKTPLPDSVEDTLKKPEKPGKAGKTAKEKTPEPLPDLITPAITESDQPPQEPLGDPIADALKPGDDPKTPDEPDDQAEPPEPEKPLGDVLTDALKSADESKPASTDEEEEEEESAEPDDGAD
jgi:hypothetical protein